jgi:hypothetical protein
MSLSLMYAKNGCQGGSFEGDMMEEVLRLNV